LFEIAKYQITQEDAQLIVVCDSSLLATIGYGSRQKFEQKLDVPVLEPPAVAIKTFEMLINRSKPPALPGRLSEFDIFGNTRKPLIRESLLDHRTGGFQCKIFKV